MSSAPRQTFPRTARLTKRREFQEVYRTGLRVPGSLATIFVRPGATDEVRLGITATRRVGNAVVRNRLRRLLRESFRRHRHRMKAWDLVVNISPRARGCSYREMEAELLRLLRRAERLWSSRIES
ncbi:MAG: ribonuclease P protein component [Acidobacteriota bacterium]|nr:ribonuclease P protein component [Acidobacteriota bacterium]